jgi:glutamate-1-semialdehyde aminotransferase
MSHLNINQSLKLYEQGRQLIPGASMTNSKRPSEYAFGAFPIYIESGHGAKVIDVDGNEYIDYILALGPITLGYAFEEIDNAVRAQMQKGVLFGLMSPLEVQAAQAVIDTVPCAEMVRFFKTGAESTTAALRVARAFTKKDVVLHCGYHGWLDTISCDRENPGVPQGLNGSLFAFPWNDESAVKVLLQEHAGEVAAIMVNPVNYYNVDDGSFLRFLRELCDKENILLIYDEIVTGYRLSLGGAQEYFKVIPDLACFAKGIANGYPVSVLCGKRNVMQLCEDLLISSTYGGETLSLAALVAAHQVYRDKDVPAVLARQGQKLMDGCNAAARQNNIPAIWEGYPCMSGYRFAYESPETNRHAMTFWLQECAAQGVLFRRGGLNFITLSHTDEIIEQTLEVGRKVLLQLAKAVEEGTLEQQLRTTQAARGRYEQ